MPIIVKFIEFTLSILIIVFFFFTNVFVLITAGHTDYNKIYEYSPPTVTRVYTKNGLKIADFAYEDRILVKYTDLPQLVIDAFLAAEDKNFFLHQGVDVERLGVAMVQTVINLMNNKRAIGASTITQQVVRNLLLNNSRNIDRKMREIVLAYKVTQNLSKEKVLELYLNQIFLGNNSYGVAAAAYGYFGKTLDQLNIEEAAVLASLPKAPSLLNPFIYPEKMQKRRNWVIQKMIAADFITLQDGERAMKKPITLVKKNHNQSRSIKYYIEAVRREIIKMFGEEMLYSGGLTVIVNLDIKLQNIIDKNFINGLNIYDKRHGWRGPIANIMHKFYDDKDNSVKIFDKNSKKNDYIVKTLKNRKNNLISHNHLIKIDLTNKKWHQELINIENPDGMLAEQQIAIVLHNSKNIAIIGLKDGNIGEIKLSDTKWAKKNLSKQRVGSAINDFDQVLKHGDIILVSCEKNLKINKNNNRSAQNHKNISNIENKKQNNMVSQMYSRYSCKLDQIPNVNGAAIAIEPYTGNITALIGGYSPNQLDKFNRATQALRQPGSVFKPIVHIVALENGMTPYDSIDDSPISVDMGPASGGIWSPKNYTNSFFGEITLTEALAKSRNIPTVKLTMQFGPKKIMEMAQRLKIYGAEQKYHHKEYAIGLGTRETTLCNMTSAYNIIASHGFAVENDIIDRIYDNKGNIVYRKNIECESCDQIYLDENNDIVIPQMFIGYKRILSPKIYKYISSMMQDTVKWGTARGLATSRSIAGKTGSTNSSYDAWFIGYGAQFSIGIYAGFDQPKTLGADEYGATISLPIFKNILNDIDEIYPKVNVEKIPDSLVIYKS